MHFKDNLSVKEWDCLLAQLGGHPLQSALWGEAKKAIDGISDQRLALYYDNKLAALIRLENRGIKPFVKIAWIPQGPTLAPEVEWKNIHNDFLNQLKKNGHALCVSSPWKPLLNNEFGPRQTVWIDLQAGKDKLWSELDKQWRYGVRSAQRAGMQTKLAITAREVSQFYALCMAISHAKIFQFQYSELFLQYLLDHSDNNDVEAKLFLVKIDNEVAAGVFVMRVGKSCHYMFGAVDRKYSKLRVGEFVQWSVIEWACEKNCTLYDLEGIDEIKNPGVASFKKKMGGKVINLPSAQIHSFNFRGKFISKLIRNKLQ